jgi:3-hydroxybutyryl-CoA dehydrogenase
VLSEVVAGADVAVEAVFEDLAVKQQLFEALDQLCPEHTILASNTSSFMPSKLASETHRPEKVLVTHYFNPPFLVPLVEIVRSDQTSDATVAAVFELMKRVGKRPALVQKEVTGFIGNRLQGALLREALWIVQQGIATPEDVDVVIKNSIGRRWSVAGVFEVFDLAGWDTILAVFASVFSALDPAPDVLSILEEMVARGELGPKSGQGFYEWTPESAEAARQKVAQALVEISQWSFAL